MSPRSPIDEFVATDPVAVSLQAEQALDSLRDLCGSQGLTANCRDEASALLINVRMRIEAQTER